MRWTFDTLYPELINNLSSKRNNVALPDTTGLQINLYQLQRGCLLQYQPLQLPWKVESFSIHAYTIIHYVSQEENSSHIFSYILL